jgi:hypothetical protein
VGYWSIWLLPLSPGIVTTIDVPGVVVGRGDEVVMVTGRISELARIQGNADATHFAIFAYTRDDRELLFNTTDPYSGIVILPTGTYILEVVAVGDWTIEIDAKY